LPGELNAVLPLSYVDSSSEVADYLGWDPNKVILWREQYREEGANGLLDFIVLRLRGNTTEGQY
jgi:hypothetical protein